LLKRNVFAKKKKLQLLQLRRPNVRQKKRQLLHANNVKKNGLQLQNKRAFACSMKRKPKSDGNNARRKNGLLPEILL
jgi:hypothetical protein